MKLKRELLKISKDVILYASIHKRSILTGATLAETIVNSAVWFKSGYRVHGIYNKMIYDLQQCHPEDLVSRKSIIMNALWEAFPDIVTGIVMTGVTGGTILYNHKVNSKQIAALGAAYTATKATLDATESKIEELFGAKGKQEVHQSIAQDETNKAATQRNYTFVPGKGSYWCLDPKTARAFRTCAESLAAAKDAISEKVSQRHWASQNDLYIELGIDQVEDGNLLGFPEGECYKNNGRVEIPLNFLVTNYLGEPAYELDYCLYPRPDYI